MATPKQIHDTILAKVQQLLAEYKPQLSRATGTLPRGTLPPGGVTTPTLADGSVTTPKLADGSVTPAKLTFDVATQDELDDHAATKGSASTSGHIAVDGVTIQAINGVISTTSAAGSTTLVGLSDVPDSYTGQAGKELRVKSDETGVEFYTPTGPTIPILIVTPGNGGSRTWSAMPLAETEIFGVDQHRLYYDLAPFSQAQLQGRFGGGVITGAYLRAQYSTDNGSTWANLDGATGPQVAMGPATTIPNIRAGAWTNLSTAAKTSGTILLRLVGEGGNGSSSPAVGHIWLCFR